MGSQTINTAVVQPKRTPVNATSGNEGNTNAVATLPGATGVTTYLQKVWVTFTGATAAGVVTLAITGLSSGGTLDFTVPVPAGVAAAGTPVLLDFTTGQFANGIPASAQNTAVVVTLPALGSGNTNATVSAIGYQQ